MLQRQDPQKLTSKKFYIEDAQVVPEDPVFAAYAQIAYNRAAWDLQEIRMPTEPKLDREFPGVDPEGKHCRVDMGFAQRLTQLKSAAALCSGTNRSILDGFLADYNSYRTGIGTLKRNVKVTCENIQVTEHAAKVCPDKTVSLAMEQVANKMATDTWEFKAMDKILTAMEQVAGLRGGALDQDTINFYNSLKPKYQLDSRLATGRNVQRAPSETVDVNFQNFDNIARQNYYANPKNWGFKAMRQIPKDPADSLELAACMRRYAGATATNTLNALFSPTEKNYDKLDELSASRATLVIVDGKTVNERMQEIYNGLSEKPNYSEWYRQNLERLSGEIVASGLMSGKRVEAYVPGPDGKLPDQPTVLHKTGYEPTPEKPVTLNAWERFFSRIGFYKEKAAQAKEHSDLLAARERVKTNYTVVQTDRAKPSNLHMKDMFFGDYLRRNGIADMGALNNQHNAASAYRINRSAATSACICLMAAQGYDIRDILDSTKLQQEKKDAANLYLQHAFMDPETRQPGVDPAHRKGDAAWLGSVFFHGQRALINQVDTLMVGMDLMDPQQRKEVFPTLRSAAAVMFDGFQECDNKMDTMHGYLQAAQQTAMNNGQPASRGNALAQETIAISTNISSFCTTLDNADMARVLLANPGPRTKPDANLTALIAEQTMLQMYNASPELPFTDRIPQHYTTKGLEDHISRTDSVTAASGKFTQGRSDWLSYAKMIQSGDFAKSFTVDMNVQDTTVNVRRKILHEEPDGTTRVDRVQMNIPVKAVTEARVTVNSALDKKMGITETITATRAAQQAAQPKSMGR